MSVASAAPQSSLDPALLSGISSRITLLAGGGRIGGGLPLTRAGLYVTYNLFETTQLIIAFVLKLRRSHAAPAKEGAIG